jgi:hypothetical protein
MMWPLRTEARNRCIGFVTSRRPVGSIDPGTSTIRPGATVTGGRVTVGRVTVGGVEAVGLLVDGAVVVDDEEDFPPDPPLQAPPTATRAATHAQKGLQARVGRVDPEVMEAAESYPDIATRQPQPGLAARVEELERVVATLASLRRERSLAERPDPVALTAALHPGGMRSTLGAKRRAKSGGTIPVRFVLFDPSTSR